MTLSQLPGSKIPPWLIHQGQTQPMFPVPCRTSQWEEQSKGFLPPPHRSHSQPCWSGVRAVALSPITEGGESAVEVLLVLQSPQQSHQVGLQDSQPRLCYLQRLQLQDSEIKLNSPSLLCHVSSHLLSPPYIQVFGWGWHFKYQSLGIK